MRLVNLIESFASRPVLVEAKVTLTGITTWDFWLIGFVETVKVKGSSHKAGLMCKH